MATNPYVGPRPFEKGETLFGRDRETSQLRDLLIAERIVLLYATSGAGKTSLIQAALIPELEKEDFKVLPIIRVAAMPPQDQMNPSQANRYLLSTLLSLDKRLPNDDEQRKKRLDELAGVRLADYLDSCIARLATPDPENVVARDKRRHEVLIFDQFEEILTDDPADFEEKEAFFVQLGVALDNAHRWALFALREENLAGLDPYRDSIPTSFNTTYRLELLTPAQARLAVQCPTQKLGVKFTDEATDKLLDELRKLRIQRPRGSVREVLGPYVEPLQLQVVCSYIWENRAQNATEITQDDVKTGHVKIALTQFCDDALHAAVMIPQALDTGVSESHLREWCVQCLITPAHTRDMVVGGQFDCEGMPNAVLDELVNRRLLRRHQEQSGVCWYELTHDRLIEPLQELSRPAELTPTPKTFTDDDLDQWINGAAYYMSRHRRLRQRLDLSLDRFIEGLISTPEERVLDWQNARMLFGCEILDGTIDFARQTIWKMYALLEDLWLSDVKQFLAYLVWENKGDGWESKHDQDDYYAACEYFRSGLANKLQIKRSRADFGDVRTYLDYHYLSAGKLDLGRLDVRAMIKKKAYRIMAFTGEIDSVKNWVNAENYTTLFYENIISAVLEEDSEKTRVILEAMQLTPATRSRVPIINCFEAAVAIYFLKPDIVENHWQNRRPPRETTL